MQIDTLLVAIMFATILTLGIAGILSSLAAVISHCTDPKRNKIFLSWLVLLLLAHFNMFWHTAAIVSVETWAFTGFLYIVTGPILIFFATSIMLPGNQSDINKLHEHYFSISSKFFYLFAALQLWILAADVFLGRGFTEAGIFNTAALVLAIVLAVGRQEKLHAVGTTVAWILLLIPLALRGMNIIE